MARILVVDDSPTQIFNLKRLLSKHGHEVLTAEDGMTGIEIARIEQPHLILMDVVMPKLNGFQATRQLAKGTSTKHIPIILVTTKNQETDEIWGRRIGAKGYITKPVDENRLLQVIDQLLIR